MKIIGKYMTLLQANLQNEPGSQCVPYHRRILHVRLRTFVRCPAIPQIEKGQKSYLQVPGKSQIGYIESFLMYMTVIPQNFKFNF
jgi:hypothetical protein